MTKNYDDDESMSGAQINLILVAHAFRNAGLASDRTAEQDLNAVKAYTINAYRASVTGERAPIITDELIAAAQRTQIRAASRGEDFILYFALDDAVRAKEHALAEALEAATDTQYSEFLEGLMRPHL